MSSQMNSLSLKWITPIKARTKITIQPPMTQPTMKEDQGERVEKIQVEPSQFTKVSMWYQERTNTTTKND